MELDQRQSQHVYICIIYFIYIRADLVSELDIGLNLLLSIDKNQRIKANGTFQKAIGTFQKANGNFQKANGNQFLSRFSGGQNRIFPS